jgi:hypothetical protein
LPPQFWKVGSGGGRKFGGSGGRMFSKFSKFPKFSGGRKFGGSGGRKFSKFSKFCDQETQS